MHFITCKTKRFYSLIFFFYCLGFLLSPPAAYSKRTSFRKTLRQVAQLKKHMRPLLKEIEQNKEKILKEWLLLAAISAPSKHEEKRAAYIRQQFILAGLQVKTDKLGNLIGIRLGQGLQKTKRKIIVLCAHMDTVHDAGVPLTVKHQGQQIQGPGVYDDVSGLISLLVTARLFQKYQLKHRYDIWFFASTQEEIGMRGAKHMLAQHHQKIAMFIAVDSHYGRISYGGLGLRWFRFSFLGQSRHTTGSYRKPSAILAAARAITQIYRLRLPRRKRKRTWLNIGRLQGGEKVNRMAEIVSFTVDLRSPSKQTLDRLERKIKRLVQKAARKSRIRTKSKNLLHYPATQLKGLGRHKLVLTAKSVLKVLGVRRIKLSLFGSSDHCPAIALGIPGINIGISKARRFHQLDESFDSSYISKGLQQVALLLIKLSQVQK